MRGLINFCVLALLIGGGVFALYAVEDEAQAPYAPPPAPMPEDDVEIDTIDPYRPEPVEEPEQVPDQIPDQVEEPDETDAVDATPPPDAEVPVEETEVVERDPLPGPSDFDEDVWVGVGAAVSTSGTAFSIGEGVWMTARHVVDGCSQTVLEVQDLGGPTASAPLEPENTEISIVTSPLARAPLTLDTSEEERRLGDDAYLIGYPKGVPGEVAGRLLGRATIQLRGRYVVGEPALVWAETSRTEGIDGHLGGLSGGPAFDEDGEVIGVMVAHAPRRGRIYTSAPSRIETAVEETGAEVAAATTPAGAIRGNNFGEVGRRLRRDLQVAKLRCVVQSAETAQATDGDAAE